MRLSDLNFRHLLYFHAVVREGSVTAAAAALRVSQPTVSAQLRQLELDLGVVLLERDGRGVKPTEAGRVVARYAEEIFELGRELIGSVAGGAPGDHNRLRVGVAAVLPKLVVARLLEPALKLDGVHVECRVGHPEELVSELAVHHLDVVLADAPLGAGASVRAFNHVLGGSAVSFCAVPSLAATLRDGFPVSLDGAPMLLPTRNTVMRRSLDAYFDGLGIAPRVVAELEDRAMAKVLASRGHGAIAVPRLVVDDVVARYGLHHVADADGVEERFYALSTERRLRNPAVVAMTTAARAALEGA